MVFAKAPIAGHAKTRLTPALGAEGAAALHARLVEHILQISTEAELCPVELWRAGEVEHEFFHRCAQQFALTLKTQHQGDLGLRMYLAFEEALATNDYAIIVGSDCPGLTAHDFAAALTALRNGADCVLSPADDGGYVLIGLRRTDLALFSGIDWGTAQVLQQTKARLTQLGWCWQLLDQQFDIDLPQDLVHLPEKLRAQISPRQQQA